MEKNGIIIYNTDDGKVSVTLYAKDGSVWMNQKQLAELFDTSVPNINIHIANILKDKELSVDSVIKDYLITAAEIIVSRADASLPNMALTSWKGGVVRKQDIYIAKNYLTHDEIDSLNRLTVLFLDSAELRVKIERVVFYFRQLVIYLIKIQRVVIR